MATGIGEQDYMRRLARLAELQDHVRRIMDKARKEVGPVLALLDREAVEARRLWGTLPAEVREVTDAPENVAPLLNRRADIFICAASLWPEPERGTPTAAAIAEVQP